MKLSELDELCKLKGELANAEQAVKAREFDLNRGVYSADNLLGNGRYSLGERRIEEYIKILQKEKERLIVNRSKARNIELSARDNLEEKINEFIRTMA